MNDVWKRRTGTVLTALTSLFLLGDGAVGIAFPKILEADMVVTAFPLWTGPIIGAISLVSGLLYAIPRTTLPGAILATGFLGGAIATHLRLGEIGSPPQIISTLLGAAIWLGLLLRGRLAIAPS